MWESVWEAAGTDGGVLTIGTFDGVHLGHRAVIGAARQKARAGGLSLVALVPDPHPRAVLGQAPPLLTSLEERGALLAKLGVDVLLRLPFDEQLAQMPPQQFAQGLVLGRLHPKHVVVGFNFSFGHRGAGTPAQLADWLQAADVGCTVVAPTELGGRPISSSRVRAALGEGDLAAVRALLGRDFTVRGAVRPGAGRGRGIGFPTANVHPPAGHAMPTAGVYAVWARRGAQLLGGVANLGARPTFDESTALLEVHLFEFDEPLYDEQLEVGFVQRLRGQQRFASVDALRRQITEDSAQARAALVVAGY